jgi:hypothetical protein
MAFPSNSHTSGFDLKTKWDVIKGATAWIKDESDKYVAATGITYPEVAGFQTGLVNKLAALDALVANAATNGLEVYAAAQENIPAINLQNEFTAMRAAIVSTITWISTNFPKDATGKWAAYVTGADGSPQPAPLAAPALSAFKTQLSTLTPTIK